MTKKILLAKAVDFFPTYCGTRTWFVELYNTFRKKGPLFLFFPIKRIKLFYQAFNLKIHQYIQKTFCPNDFTSTLITHWDLQPR